MEKVLLKIIFILIALSFNCSSQKVSISQWNLNVEASPVGYRIGEVVSIKKLKSSQKSTLYQLVTPQLDDHRPIKLIDLHGSHYQIGYDYGFLLSDEIQFSYKSVFENLFKNQTLLIIFEKFLDWQYSSYVRKNIPLEYLEQIKGIRDGAFDSKKSTRIKKIIERILVIGSIPSGFKDDITALLQDQFFQSILRIKDPKLQNYIQSNILYVITKIHQYLKIMTIKCSFFGVWGSRTNNSELYTSRNLDWISNSGINLNKLVTVFNINNQIPHATLGFPGVLGALTGISAKGITTHQAGQGSDLQTLEGFQWTLKMRQIMAQSNNLSQAIKIWNSSKTTLGMNFMLGSGSDKRAVVFQQMRGYRAMFNDNDPRQNKTIFTDPNGKLYVAGFSMPDVVYRTNHGYDETIRKHSTIKLQSKNSSTIERYFIQRDLLKNYEAKNTKITEKEAVNMTAIMGAKQSPNYYSCKEGPKGINVISVTYFPKELKMWAAFEYGFQDTFRSACCGVYIKIDLKPWFGLSPMELEILQDQVKNNKDQNKMIRTQ